MCYGGLEDGVDAALALEPVEESRHLRVEPAGLRRFVMDLLAADRPRNHLHRTRLFGTPGAHGDLGHAAAAGGKQRRVPGDPALVRPRLVIALGGVEDHFADALEIAAGG